MTDTNAAVPFKAGDRIMYRKQHKGTYLCGNGIICTIRLDRDGRTLAWIPIEQLRIVRERKRKET